MRLKRVAPVRRPLPLPAKSQFLWPTARTRLFIGGKIEDHSLAGKVRRELLATVAFARGTCVLHMIIVGIRRRWFFLSLDLLEHLGE